jgi:DNA invertase Pin-like site-specific DNA recombinase
MLEDTLRPDSDVAVIVVHHTSRFTRDSTEARVVKAKLRRIGVRVASVCQEITDDPMGKLIEGLFECIDQYESELNGVRTSGAMREAVRQGYFPGAQRPYGYRTRAIEHRPGVIRHVLEPDEDEAQVVREIYRLYVALGGAKAVARRLNQRGVSYRTGVPWSKDLVIRVLGQTAASGTYFWGKRNGALAKPPEEWTPLSVASIVDPEVYELVQRLRDDRRFSRKIGRGSARPHVLTHFIRCGRCGASYQLETSGKTVDGSEYRYCYYNCRTFCRTGREACPGFRIATDILDAAVLNGLAEVVCSNRRASALKDLLAGDTNTIAFAADERELADTWRTLVTSDPEIARSYLEHLVEKIVVHDSRIVIVPKPRHVDVEAKEVVMAV